MKKLLQAIVLICLVVFGVMLAMFWLAPNNWGKRPVTENSAESIQAKTTTPAALSNEAPEVNSRTLSQPTWPTPTTSLTNQTVSPQVLEPRRIQGVVLDAESGQPITKFRVVAGRSFGPDQFYADSLGMKDYADANGRFALSVDEEEPNVVRVAADDHADETQNLPEPQNGIINLEFRLKPSAALRGTVVRADGAPLSGVTVAIVREGFGPGDHIRLQGWRLENLGGTSKLVTTDSAGQFSLQSPPESGGNVVAASEAGFVSAPVEQVRASGVLVLQGFGQIEGVLKVGGTPATGQELLFTLGNIGIMTDFQTFRTQTDKEGNFKFTKVPAGEGQLVRLIKTTPNSWLHSHNTSVTVQAGQTTFVTLGDSGAIIRGRVRLESPPTDDERFIINGNLHSVTPLHPSFDSPAQAQAFFDSAEWKATMKQQKHFGVVVNADGSFLVDSVPPGNYSLELSANKSTEQPFPRKSLASRTITLTVPEDANPQTPIEMGEVVLPPAKKRSE